MSIGIWERVLNLSLVDDVVGAEVTTWLVDRLPTTRWEHAIVLAVVND